MARTATPKARAWDRRDDETEHQYGAFLSFLRTRSTADSARELYPEDPEHFDFNRNHLSILAREKQWKQRVVAYDRWIASVRDEETAKVIARELDEIARRRIQIMRSFYHKVKAVVDSVDSAKPRAVASAGRLIDQLDTLWRKMEAESPVQASMSAKMPEVETVSAREKIRQHMAEIAAEANERAALNGDSASPVQ